MLLYYLTSFATSVSATGLAIFVLLKAPKNRVNQTWFAMSIAVSIWSATFALSVFSEDHSKALTLGRISNLAASFIPVFFLHFCMSITRDKTRTNILFLRLGYAITFIVLMFSWTPFFIPRMRPISIFPHYATVGPVLILSTIQFHIYVVLSEFILFKKLRTTPDAHLANQIKYIMIATILGFSAGTASHLPIYGVDINPTSTHFVGLYLAIISYAIVKHSLMDIRIVIRKGLIYSLLIALITLIYFTMVFASGAIFQNYFGSRSVLVTALIFTVIALVFKPLERKLQDLVDRFIFKRTRKMLESENELLMEEVRKQNHMKSVATLAAGMAHEIKNPLTAIQTFAEYLPSKYDDPDFRDRFQRIMLQEVKRANGIVSQVLEFAKPRHPVLSKVNLQALTDDTVEFMSADFIKQNIQIIRSYGEAPLAHVDAHQIRQVVLNLFINSLKAMPNGGQLFLSIHADSGPAFVTLSVKDTGKGISKEHLPHIFEPFYTANSDGGSGLGLAIVYNIIKEHGGTISVTSEPGQFTQFDIQLKAA